MDKGTFRIFTCGDSTERDRRKRFLDLFRNCPIPEDELLVNLGLFLSPQTLSRVLLMDFLYRQILEVQGIIVEFGCSWGQSLSLFPALRGIYELFNRLRKVLGFDTFSGFLTFPKKTVIRLNEKSYSVTHDYDQYLSEITDCQGQESPLSHLKKYEIVKRDVVVEIEEYLRRNPETIIALAYFNLDLYGPTKKCLSVIRDRLARGSVIAFDELNEHVFSGETLALKEVFGLDRYSIRRFPHNACASYIIVD